MNRKPRTLVPSMFAHFIAPLLIANGVAMTTGAQERRTLDDGGFDPRKAVTFEVSATSSLHKAFSIDGQLRAESEFKKIQVYSVEENELLHVFTTSGNTSSPLFSADGKKVYAAVCRGNLGCISTLYCWNLASGERTRIGECSGLVLDAVIDSSGKRLAVTTWYGDPGTFSLYGTHKKWLGGEIVVFDVEKQQESIRILCELSGVQSFTDLANLREEPEELGKAVNKSLGEANRRCLPIRVGLTADGGKVVAVTSTGVIRVFDALTGDAELSLSRQSRVGGDIFGPREP